MTDLHPTKTRVALLRDVAAGRLEWNARDGFTVFSTIVNSRLQELGRAGWVAIDYDGYPLSATVTDEGRAVLAQVPA